MFVGTETESSVEGGGGSPATTGSGAGAGADVCPNGAQTPLVLDSQSAYGVAVSGQDVYFAFQDGRVAKTDANGVAVMNLFQGQGPASLVVADGRLFSADVSSGQIWSLDPAGGEVIELASLQSAPQSIAADADHVVWITYGFGILAGTVARVPKKGGEVEILADLIDQGIDVAVDEQAVYYTNWGIDAGVYRIDKATLDKTPLAIYPQLTGIAIDATHVYFGAGDAIGNATLVARVPKTGGEVEVLASGLPDVLRVAVDDVHVYWTSSGSTEISGSTGRAPKTGGPPEVISATPHALHAGLALDEEAVYFTRAWLEDQGPPPDGAAVVRVCK